jgi:hypothetical protein
MRAYEASDANSLRSPIVVHPYPGPCVTVRDNAGQCGTKCDTNAGPSSNNKLFASLAPASAPAWQGSMVSSGSTEAWQFKDARASQTLPNLDFSR